MGVRGSKPLTDRDWLVGARPRRLLLRKLLTTDAPTDGWPIDDLTAACGVGERGLDRHLARLERLGIARREGTRWRPVEPRSRLGELLAGLVLELDTLADLPPPHRPSVRPP